MPTTFSSPDCEIVIDKLVGRGKGLGRRQDGKVVLVAGALLGERLRVRVTQEQRDYVLAEIVEVLDPAADRVTPACPLTGECGGCDFAHIDWARQLVYKQAALHEQIVRFQAAPAVELAVAAEPPLAPASAWRWRCRVRMHCDGRELGLYRRHSHAIVPVTRCRQVKASVDRALAALQAVAAEQGLPAGEYELVASDSGAWLAVSGKGRCFADRLLADLASLPQVRGVSLRGSRRWHDGQQIRSDGPPSYSYQAACPSVGRRLLLRQWVGGFCQVNWEANALMLDRIGSWLQELSPSRVLDCFCGNGNISLVAAAVADRVLGVESDPRSVRQARLNGRQAGVSASRCRFVAGRSEAVARRLAAKGERFDCVIVDPPRRGCRRLLPALADLDCRAVLLVSCDPATLARDMGALRRWGYRLARLCAVDMFPQTHHVETLALLRR